MLTLVNPLDILRTTSPTWDLENVESQTLPWVRSHQKTTVIKILDRRVNLIEPFEIFYDYERG